MAVYQSAGKCACIHIAGSVGFIGNLFGAVADEFVLSRIESDESEGSVGKCGTCYDGELNASFSELFKDIPVLFFIYFPLS